MNNRGQALVEFVLILPVFMFALLIIIDFGIIFNEKNKVENISLDIINLYKSSKSIDDINKIYKDKTISVEVVDDYYNFSISSRVNLITPGLGKIIGDPYLVVVERNIPYA